MNSLGLQLKRTLVVNRTDQKNPEGTSIWIKAAAWIVIIPSIIYLVLELCLVCLLIFIYSGLVDEENSQAILKYVCSGVSKEMTVALGFPCIISGVGNYLAVSNAFWFLRGWGLCRTEFEWKRKVSDMVIWTTAIVIVLCTMVFSIARAPVLLLIVLAVNSLPVFSLLTLASNITFVHLYVFPLYTLSIIDIDVEVPADCGDDPDPDVVLQITTASSGRKECGDRDRTRELLSTTI